MKETASQAIRRVLVDALSNKIKAFYIGDPIQIAQQDMPCIIIEQEESSTQRSPTGLDRLKYIIFIRVVTNKKDDFGKSADKVLWREWLEELVEARDETTGQYLDESVRGVLRKQYTVGNRFVFNSDVIRYGINPRPQDVITEEAEIELTLEEFVSVPSRT